MDIQKLVIREMRDGEQRTVARVGRKAFPFFESLFVGKPKYAMVAEYDGKIIGGMMYKYLSTGTRKIAYIEEAFVDRDYHGQGVGKRLYKECFEHLWKQGCDVITALVKDDNTASWKTAMDNGFKRVSFAEGIRQLGITGMLRQYFMTPFLIAVGMDFYMVSRNSTVHEKRLGITQLLTFLLANLLLLLPIWISLFEESAEALGNYLLASFTVSVLFILPRFVEGQLCRQKCSFRFNNGGSFITLLLGLFGSILPMNANWYPEKYENTREFKRRLAVPEILKWCIFLLLPFLILTSSSYLKAVAELSSFYLIYFLIPSYPFEAFGAGRVFGYSKIAWLVLSVLSLAELIFIL